MNRISNLSEGVLVFAIVGYGVLQWYEAFCGKKIYKTHTILKDTCKNALWFLEGYVAAVVFWMVIVHFSFGFSAYINGALGIFGITKKATEYGVAFALKYLSSEMLTYFLRLWRIFLGGFICLIVFRLIDRVSKKKRRLAVWGGYLFCIAVSGCIFYDYMKKCDYFSNTPNSYSYIYAPVYMLTILTLGVAFIDLFRVNYSVENKLFGGLVICVFFLSTIVQR